ncbi:hypothetical protein BMF94_1987 [Rhodotorula taiwanensis]|uniref:Uncharacterized protein n=1 Tax=Rhodotorula taiwanensis TaxID=741276 RepID=A0A2S5BE34_9BASI|nr:hypothetical protein BMF94_1987 [Rhodotorula taiwanensis]
MGSGNTVIASVATDVNGDPISTRTLSILTSTAAAAATTTSTTTAAAENLGAPAQATYTQAGVIVTWYATTPVVVTPTAWSSGNVQAASAYAASVTTQSAYKAQAQSALAGGGASRYSAFPLASAGEWSIMLGVTVIGGLVGAVAML